MLRTIAWVLSSGLFAQAVSAQSEPASLWKHNSSVVGLFADGPSRVFRYERPHPRMQTEGVTKGTLLFEGIKAGNTYVGTAYVFSRRCGALPYSVSGPASDDLRLVTLIGNAPADLDSSCQATTYREDTLNFEFFKSNSGPLAAASVYEVPKVQPTGPIGKTTEKHVQENVCFPVIRYGISVGGIDKMKKLQISLVAFCRTCFADAIKRELSREELLALDLILADRTSALSGEAVSRVQTKYDRMFAICSEKLVQKITDELAAK